MKNGVANPLNTAPQHLITVIDQLHTWTTLPPGKEFSVTSEQVVSGCAHSQSEWCGEEKETLVPARYQNSIPHLSAPQLRHYTT